MTSPDQLFGDLFRDVQLNSLFGDSKTFVDCTPKQAPEAILAAYQTERTQPGFDLGMFVDTHFDRPSAVASGYVSDTALSTSEHINRLWEHLTRPADVPIANSSRVALPHPYVVPGGRFREIFYWDSYFTMLGLREAGRADLIRGMIANFAYLIDTLGFISNGNRTYFLSRSQPPFFALMVQLLARIDGPQVLATYLPQLRKEYDFWIDYNRPGVSFEAIDRRTVCLPNGPVLTRYWDELDTPRPESYREELELTSEAKQRGIAPEVLYKHIRAACESGWDFSSRWFANGHSLATIHTTDIVPVDLNCLIYTLEKTLQQAYNQVNKPDWADTFGEFADRRKRAIQTIFWNEETGFFHDYDAIAGKLTPALTLAGVFPLFTNTATPEQAERVHNYLKIKFLQSGGWVTTLQETGQQWDWPNGWAPLQWVVYRGLMNYGFVETAADGRNRWLALNDKVFKGTGKMTEKYNVVAREGEDAALTTGGGEYPNQDGFGWTNGVYLALKTERG